MQYPIIDNLIYAYLRNGWTGLDIPDIINYELIQSGSGIPSPTNVRPIFPATILNIGGVDVPVYCGSLDINTGVLTITHNSFTVGEKTWSRYSTEGNYKFRVVLSDGKPGLNTTANDSFSSAYKLVKFDSLADSINCFSDTANTTAAISVYDSSFGSGTIEEFVVARSDVRFVYELRSPITYQLTPIELQNAIGIKDDIAHRLKLPMIHYFPHPVIDALISASDGQQTEKENEILRHYLTPLGIGGI